MINRTGRILLLASLTFLSFSVQADSSGKSIVQLISKKETDGTIKGKPPVTPPPTRLVISLLDKSGGVKVEEIVDHPLFREVEYTNEKNELSRKALNLKNAEFFVRMNLPLSADRVQVTEVINQEKINSSEFAIR